MPEFSDYAEGLDNVGAPDGSEIIPVSSGGVAKSMTSQQIADLGGGGGGHVIEDEGTPLTQRADLNFVGAGVTATDAGGKTVITIPGGGGAVDSVNGQTGVVVLDAGDVGADPTGTAAALLTTAITNGDTTHAPDGNSVFDALALRLLITDFAKYVIDQATPSTAGGTITLDMVSQIQRIFVGSAAFSAAKTMAWSNVTNEKGGVFHFEVTATTAELTMPSEVKMSNPNFDGTDWTPPDIGIFVMGWWFDGTTRYVNIDGPYN